MNGWLTGDGCNPKKLMHENAGNNKQNVGRWSYGKWQQEFSYFTDNVVLSFENVEGMSKEEKVIIEDIIEITEDILDEGTMDLKKTDRNGRKVKKLLKSWNTK